MLESLKAATRAGLGRIAARIKPPTYGVDFAEDVVAFVNAEFERRRTEQRPWELQWRLNMAFLDGNQYLDMVPGLHTLQEIPKLYWWQEREVFNHIAPIVETRVARFTRMQPTLKVRAATGEASDQAGARVSTRLLDYVQNERMPKNIKSALFQWIEATGTAFIKNTWDPSLGQQIGMIQVQHETDQKPDDREPNLPPPGDDDLAFAGKEAVDEIDAQNPQENTSDVQLGTDDEATYASTLQALKEGDVNPIVVPPYEIYPDSPWNATINECRSIIHARAMHIDTIYELWGVMVNPEPIEAFGLGATTLGVGGLGYGFGQVAGDVGKLTGYALVKELWERPSLRYPEGRLIVVATDKVLHLGSLPYQNGADGQRDLPFTKIESICRPGCFWGRSIIERLIPIQRRYNALRNRKAEYLNRCAIGQLAVEDGSVDMDDLEENGAAPGHIHIYKKGFNPPRYVQNEQLPHTFNNEENSLLNEFTTISGVSEIARHSEAPPGVKSGVAMSIAVEQDDTRLSHTVGNYESGLVEAGKQWLRLYRQFATQQRLLRSVGRDLEVELMYWDATMIRSDDVIVETSALLAESPAQRRQMIYELLNMGLFNDPETGNLTKEGQHKVFELLQFGDWEVHDDTDKLQVKRADRENKFMSEGHPMPVNDFDDDVLHVQRHNRYRLTNEYEELNQQTGGQIDLLFKQHTMEHLMRLQQRAIQAQQQAAQEQGGNQSDG